MRLSWQFAWQVAAGSNHTNHVAAWCIPNMPCLEIAKGVDLFAD